MADTYHTQLDPALAGGITGVVAPAAPGEGLQTVIAVEPFDMKAYQASVEASTGRFTFRGLPPGEYDLIIKTVGHVYEGLTLEVAEEKPLAGKELERIRDEIKGMFFETEDYFNLKKIVRLSGTADHARLFSMQTRTRHVVDPSGAAINGHIRRFELVDLIKTRKTWQITTSRHVLRQEVPSGSADTNVTLHYSPKLGGVLVGEQVVDMGTLDLAKLPLGDMSRYASAEHTVKQP